MRLSRRCAGLAFPDISRLYPTIYVLTWGTLGDNRATQCCVAAGQTIKRCSHPEMYRNPKTG